MLNFIEIPATKKSIAQRRLIYGVGINDADYNVRFKSNNKWIKCQFYRSWTSMLTRCYDYKYQQKQPTYKGCRVVEEWLTFSNFKTWMQIQDWKGKELDKDVVSPGNKIYSSDNCVFIDKSLNSLLNSHSAKKGIYPQGVCFHKATNKFSAQCNVEGKRKHLGLFNTPQKASKTYNKFKSNLVAEIAHKQTDPRIKSGLIKHSKLILNGEVAK